MEISDLRISGLRGVRGLPGLDTRFQSKIRASSACWLWCGSSRSAGGYGFFQVPVESPRGPAWRTETAHRLVYESLHGPIPAEMEVMHSCDTPPCVRPDHLRLGTPKENGADRASKHRGLCGERVHTAKLTAEQVVEIRERYARGQESASAIARDFGDLKPDTVLAIVQGDSWRHVGGTRTLDDRRRGEANSNSPLTIDQVRELRERHAAGESLNALSRRFHVTKQSVAAIAARRTWKHVR